MNYCQSCRRHLNGAVSCPGCGAVDLASPEAQDLSSTDWTTEAAWPERDPLPAAESDAAAGGGSRAKTQTGKSSRAAPRPALPAENKPGQREFVRAAAANSAAGIPNGDDGRRSRKRQGLGLRATVTGAVAGVIVIGLLILGNLPAGGGDDPVGAIAAVATSTPHGHSPGTISTPGVPTSTSTSVQTLTSSGSSATARSSASATSPSPSSSTTSPSTSVSTTPDQSATSAQTGQSTSPSTASSVAQTSPAATQSTTAVSSPSPSASPSRTQVSCVLIICW